MHAQKALAAVPPDARDARERALLADELQVHLRADVPEVALQRVKLASFELGSGGRGCAAEALGGAATHLTLALLAAPSPALRHDVLVLVRAVELEAVAATRADGDGLRGVLRAAPNAPRPYRRAVPAATTASRPCS